MKNFAVCYVVDITEARGAARPASPALTLRRTQVPDFNTMYELFDPCTVMFFFRNKVRAARRPAAPPLSPRRSTS